MLAGGARLGHPRRVGGARGGVEQRQQQQQRQRTLDFFVTGSRGEGGGVGDRQVVQRVFEQLQACDTPMGMSARCIVSSLGAAALRLPGGGSRREEEGAAEESRVLRCLGVLESSGLCYKTYDDDHFLATSDQIELSDDQIQSAAETMMESAPVVPGEHSPGAACQGPNESPCNEEGGRGGASGASRREALSRKRCNGWHYGMREIECSGRAPRWLMSSAWEHSLRHGRKAMLLGRASAASPVRARGVWGAEFSSTGEYVVAGSGPGWLTVIHSSHGDFRLRNTWSEASSLHLPEPVRHVKSSHLADRVHWNPHDRNEVALSGKGSGDVHIYNFKIRGRPGDQHTPSTLLSHKQGHGLGGVLDFGFVDNNVVLGGFSGGSVALWDKRSSKAPKSVFSQGSGGVCHVQMLRDGHTLVGGTTGGTVQVWDIRKAVRNMSVMKMGGKDDLLLGCVKVDEQMPLLNAEGQVCVGRTMPPAEFGVHRAYAVEPIRESQVAMTIGTRSVCVLNLVHGRVSHVYSGQRAEAPAPVAQLHDSQELQPQPAAPPPQSQVCHPVWIETCGNHQALAMGGDWAGQDESGLTILNVSKRWTSTDDDSVVVMQRQQLHVPAPVACVAAHPSHPSLAVGLKDGSMWTIQLGRGEDEQ